MHEINIDKTALPVLGNASFLFARIPIWLMTDITRSLKISRSIAKIQRYLQQID